MNKRNRILLMASGVLAVAALVLTCGPALARYMETWTEDQGFQAKPLEPLKINKSIQQLDGEYVIKFTAGSAAERCRVFLAASQGVTDPANLQITLTVKDADSGNICTVIGQPEQIAEGTVMYDSFGPGTVFRFYDEQGREVPADLRIVAGKLTVMGLEDATEVTSLLRVFVEDHPQ